VFDELEGEEDEAVTDGLGVDEAHGFLSVVRHSPARNHPGTGRGAGAADRHRAIDGDFGLEATASGQTHTLGTAVERDEALPVTSGDVIDSGDGATSREPDEA
jgi:hypothetical protein